MSPREMLILVPGVNLDGELFEGQKAVLEATHDVAIADNRSDDNITAMAERLLRRAPERFALAGLSMGGYVAMEVMRRAPDQVTRLALLDTTARPDQEDAKERRFRMIALAEGGCFDKTHALLWERLVHPAHRGNSVLEAKVLRMMQKTGSLAFIRQQRAIMDRIDSRPSLPAIAVPTLVLVGDQDLMTPLEYAEEMANLIPGAKLNVVKDSGHLSPLEQPQAVAEAMMAWLKI